MYEEELAYGLGGLLRSHGNVHQLMQGMMGIVADYAHANRMLNIEGRARQLIEEFTAVPQEQPKQYAAPPPQANGHLPGQVTDAEYRNRLRTAMDRAGPAVPPQPQDYFGAPDSDPLRVYTRHAGDRR